MGRPDDYLKEMTEARLTLFEESLYITFTLSGGDHVTFSASVNKSEEDDDLAIDYARHILAMHLLSLPIRKEDRQKMFSQLRSGSVRELYTLTRGIAGNNLVIGTPSVFLQNISDDGDFLEMFPWISVDTFRLDPITRFMIYLSRSVQVYLRRTHFLGWEEGVVGALRKRLGHISESALLPVDEARSFALNLFRLIESAMRDGYNVVFCGKTGSGKTTLQVGLVNKLLFTTNGPLVIVDTYPELDAHMARMREIHRKNPAVIHSMYYCLSSDDPDSSISSLLSACTSGNIGILMIQEANLLHADVLKKVIQQVTSSGVPYTMTAFASVPPIIPDTSATGIGIRIRDEIYNRGGVKVNNSLIITLPSLSVYLVSPDGVPKPLTTQGDQDGYHPVPDLYPGGLGDVDMPPGSNLRKFFDMIS